MASVTRVLPLYFSRDLSLSFDNCPSRFIWKLCGTSFLNENKCVSSRQNELEVRQCVFTLGFASDMLKWTVFVGISYKLHFVNPFFHPSVCCYEFSDAPFVTWCSLGEKKMNVVESAQGFTSTFRRTSDCRLTPAPSMCCVLLNQNKMFTWHATLMRSLLQVVSGAFRAPSLFLFLKNVKGASLLYFIFLD